MLVALPVTSQRNTEDSPRWIELGSAVNCAMCGAAGGAGAGSDGGIGGGGGVGVGGFFLQPEANKISAIVRQMIEIVRILNMNIAS